MTQGGEDTAITQVRHDGSFESGDDGYSEKQLKKDPICFADK